MKDVMCITSYYGAAGRVKQFSTGKKEIIIKDKLRARSI